MALTSFYANVHCVTLIGEVYYTFYANALCDTLVGELYYKDFVRSLFNISLICKLLLTQSFFVLYFIKFFDMRQHHFIKLVIWITEKLIFFQS